MLVTLFLSEGADVGTRQSGFEHLFATLALRISIVLGAKSSLANVFLRSLGVLPV